MFTFPIFLKTTKNIQTDKLFSYCILEITNLVRCSNYAINKYQGGKIHKLKTQNKPKEVYLSVRTTKLIGLDLISADGQTD